MLLWSVLDAVGDADQMGAAALEDGRADVLVASLPAARRLAAGRDVLAADAPTAAADDGDGGAGAGGDVDGGAASAPVRLACDPDAVLARLTSHGALPALTAALDRLHV